MRTYGRKRYNKRSMRKRGMRRIRRNYRVPRSIEQKPVLIKRKFWAFNWTPSTVSTTDFWKTFAFNLSQMYNSGDVTNLFDQYKLCGVKVEMHPRFDNFAGNDTTDTTAPGVTSQGGNQVHIIADPWNDTVASGTYTTATLNFFLEKGNVKTYEGIRPIKFYIRPSIEQNVGVNNTGRRIRAPYLNCSNTTLPHFGFQAFIADPNMTGFFNQSYDIFYTFYVACKGRR